jgi:hypothetical protein
VVIACFEKHKQTKNRFRTKLHDKTADLNFPTDDDGMGEFGYSTMVVSFGTTRRNEDRTYPKT